MASIVNYVADGATNQFQIPFTYINQSDVVVTVNGTAPTFTFLNSTTINIAATPTSGDKVIISRATPLNPLVDFADGSTLFEADLDLAHQQNRLIAEESRDRADSAIATINANIDNIDTVAGIETNINTVAGNTANINSVATNMAEVLTADDNAATATTKANEASASASTASAQATISTTKAGESSTSAAEALASKNAASASESNASTSETNAANSATSSSNSANASASSASSANSSKNVATTKAAEAVVSANNSAVSATNSANSATTASTKANEASASQVAASNSETNALSSKNAAASSATNAATSENNSASSATASANSAATANTKAGEASTSANNAATSETNAATSSATATTQAGIATTKAGEASTSATNAAASAASAQVSKDAALSALDSFDDRYLGQKSADVTVDNDGDTLVSGALYYNTTDDIMKVYDGTQWVAAYASLSGAMFGANNLSDVASTSGARANLGLVIGTNVQAFSAILANTTASYTTAEENKLAGIETNAKDDQTITAGSGLSGGGTGDVTLSHADTSSVGNSDNSGNTFIQDINFDTYGHVTSVGTGTVSVGNGTLTVQGTGALGGSGTFTANQSGNSTISISHDDTSGQGSVNNSGATVIQDVSLDTYGHVTGLASKTLTLADLGGSASAESFTTLSSDPSSPSIGDVYYNTTDHNIRLYMDTGWQSIINLPPITSSNTYSASVLNTASSAFSLDLTQFFTDDNTPASDLVYATSGNIPNGMSVSGTNLVHDNASWSGTSGQVTSNFTVTATDGGGAISAGKPFAITLDPEPTPQLNYIPSWNSPDITRTTSGTINVPSNIPPYTVCWVQLVGSGGGSNTTDYQASWGFGGYGGSAVLIVCRADDLNGSALTVPAGGAPNPGWQGGQAHASTINIKGTIYTTSHGNNNQVVVHPAIYDVSNLTTPHFTFSAQSNSHTPSPNMTSVNSMTFGTGQDGGGSHTNSASGGNKIWAGGNGYGDYGGTGYQTSSYAGNGGTSRGANNAQELGGGGAAINLYGARGGVKVFFS
jgi:hypothetical protein